MLTAVDHVQLAAPPGTEGRLRAYYTEVLGMTELSKPSVLAARGAAGSPPDPSSCTSAWRRTSVRRARHTRACA